MLGLPRPPIRKGLLHNRQTFQRDLNHMNTFRNFPQNYDQRLLEAEFERFVDYSAQPGQSPALDGIELLEETQQRQQGRTLGSPEEPRSTELLDNYRNLFVNISFRFLVLLKTSRVMIMMFSIEKAIDARNDLKC